MPNAPWKMALAFGCLIAAGGCSVGQLNDAVLLAHGPTPDTCQKFKRHAGYGENHLLPAFVAMNGKFIDCGNSGEKQDSESRNTLYFPALALHAGDKFTVRQTVFGLGITGKSAPRDRRPPSTSDVTISLRRIGQNGYLSDEEEQFLYGILAVSRTDMYGDGDVEKLAEQLAKPAIAREMWNAMSKALRLINVRESDKQRARWQLVVSTAVLCSAFSSGGGDKTQFSRAFNFDGGSDANVCNSKNFYSIGFGFKGFQHPANASAFKVSTIPPKSRYFDRSGVSGTFEFVEVNVRGVSMRDASGPEGKWSLMEWQNSEICKLGFSTPENAVIRRLKLKGAWPVDWMTVLHGKVAEPMATHEVKLVGVASGYEGPRRVLKESDSTTRYPYRIKFSDLDKLRPNDIAEIEWGRAPNGEGWLAGEWSGDVSPQCKP